jgi:DNA-binding CsgD family transcriptional regulator
MPSVTCGKLFEPEQLLAIDRGGKLVTSSAKATRQLWEAIELASRAARQSDARQACDIIVTGDDQTPRISLSVLALQRAEATSQCATMIMAQEFLPAAVSVETLRSAFALSPAEARLLSLLATGASLRQASQIVGVSYSTVMSQIKSCFQKTGTHRQAELVALTVRLGSGRA